MVQFDNYQKKPLYNQYNRRNKTVDFSSSNEVFRKQRRVFNFIQADIEMCNWSYKINHENSVSCRDSAGCRLNIPQSKQSERELDWDLGVIFRDRAQIICWSLRGRIHGGCNSWQQFLKLIKQDQLHMSVSACKTCMSYNVYLKNGAASPDIKRELG